MALKSKNTNLTEGRLKIDTPRGYRGKSITEKETQIYKDINLAIQKLTYKTRH